MNKCPTCANPLSYVQQYSQWYCHTCQAYKVPVTGSLTQPAQPPYQAPAQQSQYQPQQRPVQPQYQQPASTQPQYQPVQQTPQRPVQPQYQQSQPVQPQPQVQPQYQAQPQYQQPQYQAQPQPMAGQDLVCRIEHSPSFSVLIFSLKPGQSVLTEKGSMMYMHNTVDIETHGRNGGILKGVVTSALGGESFFVNTYTATRGPGELALVGPTMGDIRALDVSRQAMILQSGAFLASHTTVDLDTKWQGLKGFLSERDFVMLRAYGPGKMWVSSFGAIIEKDLQPGEVLSLTRCSSRSAGWTAGSPQF
jgi:uncharacterized protein (TIGR00266 family)